MKAQKYLQNKFDTFKEIHTEDAVFDLNGIKADKSTVQKGWSSHHKTYSNIKLDWIVDDNELKQGLLTPGTNIPIKDRSSLDIDEHIVVIPLAWNFFDSIKKQQKKLFNNQRCNCYRVFKI